jgi:Ring finger domain
MSDSSSCPICLAPLHAEAHAEAFVYPCFHRFCFPCIAAWTETRRAQGARAGAGGAGGGSELGTQSLRAAFTCPLCRRPYDCVLHSFTTSGSFATLLGGSTRPLGLTVPLSAAQRRRRSLYGRVRSSTEAPAQLPLPPQPPRPVCAPRRPEHPVTLAWVERELQALLLDDDVTLLVQHVSGVLRSLAARQRDAPRVAPPAAACAADPTSAVYGSFSAFCDAVAGALRGFMHMTEATQFAAELWGWLHSGLSITAHDLATFGSNTPPQERNSTAGEDGEAHSP